MPFKIRRPKIFEKSWGSSDSGFFNLVGFGIVTQEYILLHISKRFIDSLEVLSHFFFAKIIFHDFQKNLFNDE